MCVIDLLRTSIIYLWQVIRERGGAAFSTPPPEEADKKPPPASGDGEPAADRKEETTVGPEESKQELGPGVVDNDQGEASLEPAGELHEASHK